MEKGTIYVTDDVIFAYRGEIPGNILHYACVLHDGTIRIYKYGGTGKLLDDEEIRPATYNEIRRFNDKLYEYGYKWNVANCVLTNVTTSEILPQ